MTESEKGVHTLEKFHEFEDKWCPAQYRGILASEENIQEGHFKELYHAISTEGSILPARNLCGSFLQVHTIGVRGNARNG